MKIYCDYCGTQIDTNKDITCPNCGGAYANDEELKNGQKREENSALLGDLDKRIYELREQQIRDEMIKHQKEQHLEGIIKVTAAVISTVILNVCS